VKLNTSQDFNIFSLAFKGELLAQN